MRSKIPHCSEERDWSAASPRVSFSDGGRYLKVSFARSPAMEWNQEHFYNADRTSKRGVCRGYSFGSRRRMLDRLNQISVTAEKPLFITLTYPDQRFEDSVSRFAASAKNDLDVFLKRLRRACPSACGFWRIEWKARKSGLYEGKLFPHFHMLVWGLPQRWYDDGIFFEPRFESFVPVPSQQLGFGELLGKVRKEFVFPSRQAVDRFSSRAVQHKSRIEDADHIKEKFGIEHTFMSAFDWVSMAWYYVVDSHNVDHFMAGASVEQLRTWGGVVSYCSKYMSKADSEDFMADEALGRSWGIFNRVMVPWAKMVQLELDDETGNRLRRIARHYLERRLGKRVQRHYGMTLYCDASKWKPLFARPPDTPF